LKIELINKNYNIYLSSNLTQTSGHYPQFCEAFEPCWPNSKQGYTLYFTL